MPDKEKDVAWLRDELRTARSEFAARAKYIASSKAMLVKMAPQQRSPATPDPKLREMKRWHEFWSGRVAILEQALRAAGVEP